MRDTAPFAVYKDRYEWYKHTRINEVKCFTWIDEFRPFWQGSSTPNVENITPEKTKESFAQLLYWRQVTGYSNSSISLYFVQMFDVAL